MANKKIWFLFDFLFTLSPTNNWCIPAIDLVHQDSLVPFLSTDRTECYTWSIFLNCWNIYVFIKSFWSFYLQVLHFFSDPILVKKRFFLLNRRENCDELCLISLKMMSSIHHALNSKCNETEMIRIVVLVTA
jgi:hypothetical protein